MAITPTKPDRQDVTSHGKVRVWLTPTISAGGDTLMVGGIKEVWSVEVGNRPATTFTYTTTGASNSAVVLTVTVTASCTGGVTPLVVYGH
jgi:hypothetical protein